MRKHLSKPILSIGLAVFAIPIAVAGFSYPQRVARAANQRNQMAWQYKVIVKVLSYNREPLSDSEVRGAKCFDGSTEVGCATMLDALGAQGWELVTVTGESLVGGNKDWSGVTTAESFFFKKPTAPQH